jgi:hypothetical protein
LLAVLVTGCSSLAQPLPHKVSAPAGWESFCFPVAIGFVPGTDEITPGTRWLLAPIYESHLSQYKWLYLVVLARQPDHRVDLRLANRRARAAVRMITQLGFPHDHIAVEMRAGDYVDAMEHDLGRAADAASPAAIEVAGYFTSMIPPEEVERLRIQYERERMVVC